MLDRSVLLRRLAEAPEFGENRTEVGAGDRLQLRILLPQRELERLLQRDARAVQIAQRLQCQREVGPVVGEQRRLIRALEQLGRGQAALARLFVALELDEDQAGVVLRHRAIDRVLEPGERALVLRQGLLDAALHVQLDRPVEGVELHHGERGDQREREHLIRVSRPPLPERRRCSSPR